MCTKNSTSISIQIYTLVLQAYCMITIRTFLKQQQNYFDSKEDSLANDIPLLLSQETLLISSSSACIYDYSNWSSIKLLFTAGGQCMFFGDSTILFSLKRKDSLSVKNGYCAGHYYNIL